MCPAGLCPPHSTPAQLSKPGQAGLWLRIQHPKSWTPTSSTLALERPARGPAGPSLTSRGRRGPSNSQSSSVAPREGGTLPCGWAGVPHSCRPQADGSSSAHACSRMSRRQDRSPYPSSAPTPHRRSRPPPASDPQAPTWAPLGSGVLHTVAPGPVPVIVVSRGTPGGEAGADGGGHPETSSSRPRLRLAGWPLWSALPLRPSLVHSTCCVLGSGRSREGRGREGLQGGLGGAGTRTHHFLWALPSAVQECSMRPP